MVFINNWTIFIQYNTIQYNTIIIILDALSHWRQLAPQCPYQVLKLQTFLHKFLSAQWELDVVVMVVHHPLCSVMFIYTLNLSSSRLFMNILSLDFKQTNNLLTNFITYTCIKFTSVYNKQSENIDKIDIYILYTVHSLAW